ncbi:MAG: hypothetical protein U0359_00730 [Byssovorax sp.]
MIKNVLARLAPACLAILTSVGCARNTGAQASCAVETFTFAGADTSSVRVDRMRGVSRAEALHGETTLAGGLGRVVEDAHIDERGVLTSAKIALHSGGAGPDLVAVFNRSAGAAGEGTIDVWTAGGTDRWTAPADSPWVLVPIEGKGGQRVPTPVAAIIAARAAEAAGGRDAWVRVIDVSARRSYRTPSDQVVVPSETGRTVVFGPSAVDLDASFVREVRWPARDLKLDRVDGAPPVAPPASSSLACAGLWKEERPRL